MTAERPGGRGWWAWFTPVSISDVAERRHADLVAFLLLLTEGGLILSLVAGALLTPVWLKTQLAPMLGIGIAYAGVLALNRTRHYRLAATLFCLVPLLGNFAAGLATPSDPIWFVFLALAAILASALLPLHRALAIGALGVAATTAAVAIRSDVLSLSDGALRVGTVTLITSVVLGLAHHRNGVERARLAEVDRLAHQLAATERLESIGRFAGGVAHDFNNLLTVILANVEFARRGSGGSLVLDEIDQAASRAATLTQQLLAFSRNQASATTAVRLDSLLDAMRPLLRRLVPESIELEVELGATWAVDVDESQLHQVVMNLAANARDAMPDGGRLRFATSQVTGPGAADERVRLEVSDTGQGMDETTRARAFEPFFTTKGVGKGTGLGLATVHGVVRQRGGTIELISSPGAGTAVVITLPRSRAEPRAAVTARPTDPPRHATGIALLVEDEPHLRSATERILRDLGLAVVVAASAAEVPRALRDAGRPIDLLVSDLVMPGQSGLELARELRAAHPGLAIVLMSGYAEEDVGAAAAWPATRFLAKPFTVTALAAAVTELLAERTPPPPVR